MAALVAVEANHLLDASSATATYTAPTGAIKVALNTTTTTPTATVAGSEVTGGSYARQTVTFGSAAAGANASNVALTYTNMPATTVHSVDEWDSAGTPVRRWFGVLAADKTTNAGDTLSIASGSYTKTLT